MSTTPASGARRALITGATDGIGRETALALARRGVDVVLHGRSPERLAATQAAVARAAPGVSVETVAADLSDLAQVRRMASELAARHGHLDALINNAGIYANAPALTADGWESTFGVNHVAPFVLTLALLPLLRAAPVGRVVNVSSVAHTRGRLDPASYRSLKGFDPYRSYAQSKLANVLFTVELQRREPALAVNALHPGVVSTKLLTAGFGMQGPDSLEDGAATSVWLAASDAGATLRGAYCVRARPAAPSPLAQDPEAARQLWADTEAGLEG
jgi:NAD(P)-dependent dehydrogenase (short-subunit alcohol dehydrogenase family)